VLVRINWNVTVMGVSGGGATRWSGPSRARVVVAWPGVLTRALGSVMSRTTIEAVALLDQRTSTTNEPL